METDTTTHAPLTTTVVTRTRAHLGVTTYDIVILYAGEEAVIGTMRKTPASKATPWVANLGTFAKPDVVYARSKWEAVLETCRVRCTGRFNFPVLFKYGSRELLVSF